MSYRFEINDTAADATIETCSDTEFAIYIADDVIQYWEDCESGLSSCL